MDATSGVKTPPLPGFSNVCIAVVGMNGVGKSHFGKSLASKLGMQRIDTDTEFRRLHGGEHAYIEQHGWEAFRKLEEEIVLQSLKPGFVVVLGGGAVESPAIRAALKEKAIVLWMQAGKKKVHKHLRVAKVMRPEFKDGSSKAAVHELLQKRTPLYEEVCDIALYPHLKFSEHVPMAIELLKRHLNHSTGAGQATV